MAVAVCAYTQRKNQLLWNYKLTLSERSTECDRRGCVFHLAAYRVCDCDLMSTAAIIVSCNHVDVGFIIETLVVFPNVFASGICDSRDYCDNEFLPNISYSIHVFLDHKKMD